MNEHSGGKPLTFFLLKYEKHWLDRVATSFFTSVAVHVSDEGA